MRPPHTPPEYKSFLDDVINVYVCVCVCRFNRQEIMVFQDIYIFLSSHKYQNFKEK